MGIILFIIASFFISLIIIMIHSIKKDNSSSYYYPLEEEQDTFNSQEIPAQDTFPYPDPYNLPPENSIYLDQDGEILEDL